MNTKQSNHNQDENPKPDNPEFWRSYRIERIGGTVYIENEAGIEAFTVNTAEAFAKAILIEIKTKESNKNSMTGPIDDLKKQTYNKLLDRMGYFCTVCGKEVRNASGLVYFTSPEAVKPLQVCHDCLPDDFE